jgi:coproporphyrinogen III oxidase
MAGDGNNTNVQAAMGRLLVRFRDTICAKYAVEAEQLAKANAPWKDRTGEARKLLKGKVIEEDDAVGFALIHRVEYGKHLETANSGKYAILKPTIEALRAGFLSAARIVFGGK